LARKGKLPVKQAIKFLFGLLFIIALIVSLATADDLFHTGGPEGGDDGGFVVATGTPEQIAKTKRSYTGKFLKGVLAEEQRRRQ